TVTVHCIKINQVCKAETGKVLLHYFINMIHSVHVTFVMVSFIDPFTREDIINLTNTNYIVPCCTKTIHISLTNWLQTKVMSISSPGKVIFIGTNIWTGNNPTNSIFWTINKCPSIFTNLVEFLNRNNIFMSSNLHY